MQVVLCLEFQPTLSYESPDKETIHKSICDLQEILSQNQEDLQEELLTVDTTETEEIE